MQILQFPYSSWGLTVLKNIFLRFIGLKGLKMVWKKSSLIWNFFPWFWLKNLFSPISLTGKSLQNFPWIPWFPWSVGTLKNLSHCTWKGTGKNTGNIFRTWRLGTRPIFQVLKMFPVINTSVLPCPCLGAVWKVLIKTIQPILPGPGAMWKVLHNTGQSPCLGPSSRPSQCEYTTTAYIIMANVMGIIGTAYQIFWPLLGCNR